MKHAGHTTRSARPERSLNGAETIRRMLLALVLFGAAGLTAEMVLLEHYESLLQWAPAAVLGGALVSGVALWVRPSRRTVRAFQGVMLLMIVSAAIGLYLHLRGNAEFEREMDTAAGGVSLFWRSLRGATPVLAPGAMAQLGLIGLILSYRHPALRRNLNSRKR